MSRGLFKILTLAPMVAAVLGWPQDGSSVAAESRATTAGHTPTFQASRPAQTRVVHEICRRSRTVDAPGLLDESGRGQAEAEADLTDPVAGPFTPPAVGPAEAPARSVRPALTADAGDPAPRPFRLRC